jgi:hypothetical protein
VSGAPNQVSDDEFPISRLHVTSPLGLLPVLLLPRLPTVMMKFPFGVPHTVLLWFRAMVMLRFFSSAPAFLAFLPPPPLQLFALNLPRSLAAVADALPLLVNIHLLLLLLQKLQVVLHRDCHTQEDISHALKAGGQGTFIYRGWYKEGGGKMPLNSTQANTIVCQP